MQLITKTKEKIVFEHKIEESLANAIRRYISNIPILAIEEAEIIKNDSPLYDETVSHRLGLIPLKYSKVLNDKTEIELKLKVKKPGYVYAEELKGDAEIVFGKIPITLLNENQELEIKAYAKAGIGKEHSKFYPGLMFYHDIFNIKVSKECPKEVVDSLPKNIKDLIGKNIKLNEIKDIYALEIIAEKANSSGKENITTETTGELRITVESFGQLKPEDIFKKSIDYLKKDLIEVSKKLK